MRLASLLLVLLGQAAPAPVVQRVTVTVLATTDSHGYIYPYDYFTKQPAARGLAAAATLIQQVRRETPHTLLVDCGDTIQGSPLTSLYQAELREGRARTPEPMMLAMSRMGYDAMVVGNHEFNYGLPNLSAARDGARFPWLSANTETGGVLPPFASYLLKTVAGVKLAVIGVTTAAIPQWEKPDSARGPARPKPALSRRPAAGRPGAADRDQQLPGGGLGRLFHVPRREDPLA